MDGRLRSVYLELMSKRTEEDTFIDSFLFN